MNLPDDDPRLRQAWNSLPRPQPSAELDQAVLARAHAAARAPQGRSFHLRWGMGAIAAAMLCFAFLLPVKESSFAPDQAPFDTASPPAQPLPPQSPPAQPSAAAPIAEAEAQPAEPAPEPAAAPAESRPDRAPQAALDEVVVTGSRLRTAPPPAVDPAPAAKRSLGQIAPPPAPVPAPAPAAPAPPPPPAPPASSAAAHSEAASGLAAESELKAQSSLASESAKASAEAMSAQQLEQQRIEQLLRDGHRAQALQALSRLLRDQPDIELSPRLEALREAALAEPQE